jgi:glucose-6-phosphate 1-dehydrogenase
MVSISISGGYRPHSIQPLVPADVVTGQYRGYQEVRGVARDPTVETFAALRSHVDTWRRAGVPFDIRAGQHLPVTVTEVRVDMRPPPQHVSPEPERRGDRWRGPRQRPGDRVASMTLR